MRSEAVNLGIQRRTRAQEPVLGVDGGGTKTRAVIVDESQRILGEGAAGPSNPLRVGVASAVAAIREAVDQACAEAGIQRSEIIAAEIGLAGVKRADIRTRMREGLARLGIEPLEVVTDADIALFGATGGKLGVVVIAGTGSISCGVNGRGQHACAGGWGPIAGDEGGGSWIARRALQAVARASDGRGSETSLTAAACAYFGVAAPDDLGTAIYVPTVTNDRIAGFGRLVIEAAQKGDRVAVEILCEAGGELGRSVAAVVSKLRMEGEEFQVAYVGGVFAAQDLIFKPLLEKLARVAPGAYLAPPVLSPAVAAARMAREHLRHLAVAV